MTLKTNLTALATTDFTGWYVDPLNGDFKKKGDLSKLPGKGPTRSEVPDDYCARVRSGAYDLGALQSSLGDCDTTRLRSEGRRRVIRDRTRRSAIPARGARADCERRASTSSRHDTFEEGSIEGEGCVRLRRVE